jgi:hypothetical protein
LLAGTGRRRASGGAERASSALQLHADLLVDELQGVGPLQVEILRVEPCVGCEPEEVGPRSSVMAPLPSCSASRESTMPYSLSLPIEYAICASVMSELRR